MAIYLYECQSCRSEFEALLPSHQTPAPPCSKCGAEAPKRLIAPSHFRLRTKAGDKGHWTGSVYSRYRQET